MEPKNSALHAGVERQADLPRQGLGQRVDQVSLGPGSMLEHDPFDGIDEVRDDWLLTVMY